MSLTSSRLAMVSNRVQLFLFKEFRRLNIGCCIGQNYVGIIGYADDHS